MRCPLDSCQINGCRCLRDYGIFAMIFALGLVIWVFKFNQPLFYLINSWHVLLPKDAWDIISLLSYPQFFILPGILVIVTAIWRKDKILRVLILLVAYYVVFAILKSLVGEARPYISLPEGSFYWLSFNENIVRSAYRSFPSGHTGNITIFVFSLNYLFFSKNKTIRYLLLILLVLTAISRICTGWHWPLDVLFSGLLAYILVKVCFYEMKKP